MPKAKDIKKKVSKKAKKHLITEDRYDITMYKLLGIFAITIFVALMLGMFFGNKIGYSEGVDAVEVATPEYCHAEVSNENVTIVCNELKDMTADELCEKVSDTLKKNLRIVVITS